MYIYKAVLRLQGSDGGTDLPLFRSIVNYICSNMKRLPPGWGRTADFLVQ